MSSTNLCIYPPLLRPTLTQKNVLKKGLRAAGRLALLPITEDAPEAPLCIGAIGGKWCACCCCCWAKAAAAALSAANIAAAVAKWFAAALNQQAAAALVGAGGGGGT